MVEMTEDQKLKRFLIWMVIITIIGIVYIIAGAL